MNKRTLTALRGSIKKWEAIVAGTGVDNGPDNCPLCAEFFDSYRCHGCPVSEATGVRGCEDTPYYAWEDAHQENGHLWGAPYKIQDDDSAIAAVLELEWLKSLLPGAK